ncbi:MAG: DUF4091 domain-containing protein [Candidatus Sumerlaeia bacterium]|nr:DUF4091 domain-containing protein [Candidatus Sumerlaeia bacterium]
MERMRAATAFFAIVFATMCVAVSLGGRAAEALAGAQPTLRVWTLGALDRALRDTPPEDRPTAHIAAARNEWESFQIALRSSVPVRILHLAAKPFRSASGRQLPADCFSFYREHQIHLTYPSPRNSNFRPGWYPDALIPLRNPITGDPLRGGRFEAVPFDLPANETHAFWVDIHIPADAQPGRYTGEVAVDVEGRPALSVPVEIEVWEFALPAKPAMYSEFGSPAERLPRYYATLQKKGAIEKMPEWKLVEEQCARLMSEHRLNAPPPSSLLAHTIREDGSFELNPSQIEGLRRWAATYPLNAIPVPRPRGRFKDPVADRARIHRWLKSWDRAFDAAGLGDLLVYTYLHDEPNDPEAYESVRQWGGVVRQSGSRVKVLVVEQTKTQDPRWGDLYGAVDIWCSLYPLFDPETAAARQQLGEMLWCYTALCQQTPTPWWETDFPLLHYRVPAWIAWRYGINGQLYWGGMTVWTGCDDVWTDPANYRHGEKKVPYIGEGMLTYPARDVGFDGIVPSMRLKALRDGMEDYDYLALLEAKGLRSKATDVVLPVGESWFKWSPNAADYYAAREKLAKMIMEKK